jgi:DNA-binding LacI/PurR family transcriptional regulator
MSDVARRAGVSRQLVSLVLRHEAGPSAASREAVLEAVADLGFQANTSAQLLRQERTRLIWVMFEPRITFESRFVERLLERAARERLGVVLGPVTPVRTTDVVVTELLGHRVEALGCFNPDPSSAALRTAIARMPVIWLGERSVEPRVDAVHSDDVAGLLLLVEHLVGLGHRDIAYAGGLGGRVGPDRAGVRVPEDVSVTGYDDSDIAALSYQDLTAVRQDADLSAAEALRAMTRRLEDPSAAPLDVATPATLTVRGSTGPARTRTAQDGGGRPGSRME